MLEWMLSHLRDGTWLAGLAKETALGLMQELEAKRFPPGALITTEEHNPPLYIVLKVSERCLVHVMPGISQ